MATVYSLSFADTLLTCPLLPCQLIIPSCVFFFLPLLFCPSSLYYICFFLIPQSIRILYTRGGKEEVRRALIHEGGVHVFPLRDDPFQRRQVSFPVCILHILQSSLYIHNSSSSPPPCFLWINPPILSQ